MSVKKGERKLSCNEAFHVAHQIKNELINYVLIDMGIDTAKSGHLCKCMNPKRISAFRRRLKKQFVLCIQGRMSFKDVENAFKSWIMSFKKILSKRSLCNLYNLYSEQFIHAFTLYGGAYGREAYNCT